jgi:hypothetical protein
MSGPCQNQSNRLLSVVKLCMSVGAKHLTPYGSVKSRHDFTQCQLMTCLILRAYLKTTYRGVVEQLGVSSELREAIGLRKLPNYSTLKKFTDRPGVREVLDAMLQTLAGMVDRADTSISKEAAMDSTGLETSSASAHFRARSGKKRKRYVKLSVVVLCGSLVPASLVVDWGPTNDKVEAASLLQRASQVIRPDTLFADAGYDAEWIHAFCHERWKVSSIIKPVRHTSSPPGGLYRSAMTPTQLKASGYGRRWHAESYMSGLKRTMGSTLNARTKRGLMMDAALKVLAYAFRR